MRRVDNPSPRPWAAVPHEGTAQHPTSAEWKLIDANGYCFAAWLSRENAELIAAWSQSGQESEPPASDSKRITLKRRSRPEAA